MTTKEIAGRFDELARQEKWFEIQDELFSDDITSTDPVGSPYFGYAEGRAAVRAKGEAFTKTIRDVHHLYTGSPVVCGDHFVVSREVDVTAEGFGRVRIDQLMLYRVRDGKIISEQFFY